MTEIFFAISWGILMIALLVFFFLEKKEELTYKKHLEIMVTEIPKEMQVLYGRILEDRDKQFSKMLDKTFSSYLKHIQALEKMAIPKPITTKMVKEVMERDLPTIENEIDRVEEDSIPVTETNLPDIINKNPKIVFESDDGEIPTVIE